LADKINAVISDYQLLFREGIHFSLSGEEDICVIGETVTNAEAVKFVQTNPPDVVIINLAGPGMTGLEAIQLIKRDLPAMSLILTLDTYDEDNIFDVLVSGANGCIFKDDSPEAVINVIHRAGKDSYPIAALLLKSGIAAKTLREFETYLGMDELLSNLLSRLTQVEQSILQRAVENESQFKDEKNHIEIANNLESIRYKLVDNRHHYDIFKAAQSQLTALADTSSDETSGYITKNEFGAFRSSIEQLISKINSNPQNSEKQKG